MPPTIPEKHTIPLVSSMDSAKECDGGLSLALSTKHLYGSVYSLTK
jgi:hypothetical protein